MSKGIKLLLSGKENSGKSTLTSKIDKALVVVVDAKTYPFSKPHYRIDSYDGIVDFKNTLIAKIKAYKEKFGELPKTVVIDTITKMYELMYLWSEENFKGFDKFNSINRETLLLNNVVEKTLIEKGINVVIVAHAVWDEGTNSFVIPAMGQFAKSGGWLSVVDNASFIYVLGHDRYIAHKELKYPCRSVLDNIQDSELLDKYDINEHISRLEETMIESESEAL
jgi:hypothetical protein